MGLLDHLSARLNDTPYSFDRPLFNGDSYAKLTIKQEMLNFHGMMHINYTSYDGKRKQDTLKPFLHISSSHITSDNSDHCMIMLASSEDDKVAGEHPFWYAQVLAIFHCVAYASPVIEYQRVDILWVRWLGRETGYAAGPEAKRLDKIGFLEGSNSDSSPFGFVNPRDVIRSVQLIPSFQEGHIDNLLGRKSVVQGLSGDWSFYYVGRYHYFCLSCSSV